MHQGGPGRHRNQPIGCTDLPTTSRDRLERAMHPYPSVSRRIEEALHALYLIGLARFPTPERAYRSPVRNLWEEVDRVLRDALVANFEVEMRAAGASGRAHQSDELALGHRAAGLDQHRGHVAVDRMETVAVVDLDVDPIRAPAGKDHRSPVGGDFRRPDNVRDIDPGVVLPEGLGDDALGRQDKPDDMLTAAPWIRRACGLRQNVDTVVPLRRQVLLVCVLMMPRRRGRNRLRGSRWVAKRRLALRGHHDRRAAGGCMDLSNRMFERQWRQQKDKARQGERPAMSG